MLELKNISTKPTQGRWTAKRLLDEPIIHAELDGSIGENIQGPSLIKVPSWVTNPLGQYYLYFADHKGKYIRLAYADRLTGPWTIHRSGALQLEDSGFPTELAPEEEIGDVATPKNLLHSVQYERSETHIASPDVHVDDEEQKIVMYFHGLEDYGVQVSRCATSDNGIDFHANQDILGPSYLRVLPCAGNFIATTMPGRLYSAKSWFGPFEQKARFFNPDCRHMALCLNQNYLYVFWTQVGEVQESIKVSWFDLNLGLDMLVQNNHGVLLRPEQRWEGSEEPLEPSVRSVAYGVVNQLRDPAIYVEGDRVYLLYAGGGESAIGIAELTFEHD